MTKIINSKELEEATLLKLTERGVALEKIAEIVYLMQKNYNPDLTHELCLDSVKNVLKKREIQHAILVGIELDVLAERGALSEPLQSLIQEDESLFGCDETLALGASFGYGSIAIMTLGHLDKQKIGQIKELDTKSGEIHTFLDDLVACIAACAAGRIAHQQRDLHDSKLLNTPV